MHLPRDGKTSVERLWRLIGGLRGGRFRNPLSPNRQKNRVGVEKRQTASHEEVRSGAYDGLFNEDYEYVGGDNTLDQL